MNSLKQSFEQIQNEWRSLQNQWQATSQLWNDVMYENFEREYWLNFEQTTQATLQEIGNFAEIIEKAYREIPEC